MPKLLYKTKVKELTIPEAAEQLGVSQRTLYRWIERGFIKATTAEYPKGSLRIPPGEISKFKRS